jgi:hypothetical protein
VPAQRTDKEFEDQARRLLELDGHTTGEIQFGHKKVDLLLESYRFGERRLTAVECKAWASPLTLRETTTIYADYQPLLANHQVDEVLLVTRSGLSAAGRRLIRDSRGFAHLTLAELANSVLDLTSYMRGLSEEYHHAADGLASYYIPLKVEPGKDLFRLTSSWIAQSTQPMAVLGAYGSGKSSFALHLVAHLADAAANDSSARRPILIRLSDVSAEQSLEGLIGRTLGLTVAVPNYSFDRFMALNRDGRFVVVLDGFDEMKRTLSWDEFRYNLEQLNRLVTPESRVLLLGRPTAFLNDEEYEYALHGRQQIGQSLTRVADWPDYTTHRIEPFTPSQVERFLDRYLRSAATRSSGRRVRAAARARQLDATIAQQIDRVRDGHLQEIAKRPVQLKMLAVILPDWNGSLDRLDTTVLFDHFIDRIIERDAKKLTRARFTTKQRRAFATSLAWWLWNEPSKRRVTADEIPAEIIDEFRRKRENADVVRRDLVAACFLDRSHGGPLVFPHRSFQEFLVACRMLDLLTSGRGSIAQVDRLLNLEVADFLSGLAGTKELARADAALAAHRGVISDMLAGMWFRNPGQAQGLVDRFKSSSTNPWHIQLVTTAVLNQALALGDSYDAFDPRQLLGRLRPGVGSDYALLVWRCILQLGRASHDDALIEAGLKRLLTVGQEVASTQRMRGDVPITRPGTRGYLRPDPGVALVLHQIVFDEREQTMNLRGTYRSLATRLKSYCAIREASPDADLPRQPIALQDGKLIARVRDYVTAR